MVEDHRPRIKECAAAAVQSALSLPRTAAADSLQPNFLRQLMDYLKSVGDDHLRVCIQLWMQRSCSDQPSTCTAIKNLGRCYEMHEAPDDLRPAIRKRARAVFFGAIFCIFILPLLQATCWRLWLRAAPVQKRRLLRWRRCPFAWRQKYFGNTVKEVAYWFTVDASAGPSKICVGNAVALSIFNMSQA